MRHTKQCLLAIKRDKTSQEAFDLCQGLDDSILKGEPKTLGLLNKYDVRSPCIGDGCYQTMDDRVTKFMNRKNVQKFLLGGKSRFLKWNLFNYEVNQALVPSTWFADDTQLIGEILKKGVKVVIYNGDNDYLVNSEATLEILERLEWPGSSSFKQKKFQKVEGIGEGKQEGLLTFIKVKDSGHLVPLNQPKKALSILKNFLLKDFRLKENRSNNRI